MRKNGGKIEMARTFWLTIIAILVLGCAKDILVKPPTTLVGVYDGKCTVLRNYGSSNPGPTLEQWVEWTFSDYRFWMKATRTDEKPQVFCDANGNYVLESQITLKDTVVIPTTCDRSDVPLGTFSLLHLPGDTLEIKGAMGVSPNQRYLTIVLWKKGQ